MVKIRGVIVLLLGVAVMFACTAAVTAGMQDNVFKAVPGMKGVVCPPGIVKCDPEARILTGQVLAEINQVASHLSPEDYQDFMKELWVVVANYKLNTKANGGGW